MPLSLRRRQNSACPSDFSAAPPAGAPGPSAPLSWSAGVHAPSWNDCIAHNFLLSLLLLCHPLLIPFAPPSASCHNSHVLRAPIWPPFQRRDILKTAGGDGGCDLPGSGMKYQVWGTDTNPNGETGDHAARPRCRSVSCPKPRIAPCLSEAAACPRPGPFLGVGRGLHRGCDPRISGS